MHWKRALPFGVLGATFGDIVLAPSTDKSAIEVIRQLSS